jgi:hypothetical protein
VVGFDPAHRNACVATVIPNYGNGDYTKLYISKVAISKADISEMDIEWIYTATSCDILTSALRPGGMRINSCAMPPRVASPGGQPLKEFCATLT